MPSHGAETSYTVTYPSTDQRERWEERADEMDMSLSGFIQAMTEAGMKKFEVDVEPDQSHRELRQQRNELRSELGDARERIDRLEEQLYDDERAAVAEFVSENPGAEFSEIVQHVANSVPERVNRHIDALEGDEITEDGGLYFAEFEADIEHLPERV